MKYCIDGRQSYPVLNKTDEIKVSYRDKGILMDFIEKIPDKMIILDIPYEEQFIYIYIFLFFIIKGYEHSEPFVPLALSPDCWSWGQIMLMVPSY